MTTATPVAWPVYWHDTIDSTNEEAQRLASAGDVSNQWIAARAQTQGRGRRGRSWSSPEGNLYVTAVFHEPEGIPAATRIPFVAAIAVADTIRQLAPGSEPRLKWPNDVRVDGAKMSGILVEAGNSVHGAWIACGIGMNVSFAPDNAGQAATSLADLRGDASVTPDIALESLRPSFADRLAEARMDFSSTLEAWIKSAEGVGQTVSVTVGDNHVQGIFEGLEPDGALSLRLPDGQSRVIRAGDVSLVKER